MYICRNLFQSHATQQAPTKGGRGKAAQHISVSAKFREQLNGLMRMLSETTPLVSMYMYVRTYVCMYIYVCM